MTSKQVTAKLTEDLKGLEARCPYCGARVECRYGEDGQLVWWVNVGEQCCHFRGMYQGFGTVVAHFQSGGNVQ